MQSGEESSGSSAKRSARIFYGWWIVAAVSSLYVLGNGVYWSAFSFYFLPVSEELELSRTSISLAPGLARVVGGLQGPVAGYLVDRLGPRLMIIFGGVLGCLGFVLLAHTPNYLTFLLVYLGLVVIGFSGGFDHGILAVTNRWFVRRKARAMSFLWVGISLGTAFVAPLVGLMVVNIGWRDTATISGVALLALSIPAFLVIRNLPEDMGLEPDGQRTPSSLSTGPRTGPSTTSRAHPKETEGTGNGVNPSAATGVSPSSQEYTPVDFTAKQGFRTLSYWLLALAMGLRVAAQAGLMTHFAPIMDWQYQSVSTAALLLGIYGLVSIPLQLVMGWFGDRWQKQKVTSYGMLLGGLSLGILLLSNGQLWQLVTFILLLAAAESTGVVAWAMVGDLFGRKAFATLLGGMTLVYSLMSATTPVLAGWIFDTTGSYFGALLLMSMLYVGASVLFWNIPRPKLPARPV